MMIQEIHGMKFLNLMNSLLQKGTKGLQGHEKMTITLGPPTAKEDWIWLNLLMMERWPGGLGIHRRWKLDINIYVH